MSVATSTSGGAPVDAKYITQMANSTLTNEQALSSLDTGLVKNTTGTGVLSIAAAGTDYQVPLATTWQNVAWVDAIRGNDSTAALGRPDKSYATIAAASTAALTAGGNWLIHIRAGTYTDTGLLPGDADATLAYYYDLQTIHNITGAGNLFDWTGDYTGKTLCILGWCNFTADNSTTGKVIESSYTTTAMDKFIIECQSMVNANGRTTSMFAIRGVLGSNGSTIIAHDSLDDHAGTPFYFRVDLRFIYIHANFIRGIDTDGSASIVVRCGYFERARVAPNMFGPAAMVIDAAYRIKGTGAPAIYIRDGNIVVRSPKYEVTDGQASIIQIPSNAHATEPVQITVMGGYMRQWTGGSSPPITFDAVNANYTLRLHNVHILVENSATESIHAAGPQTIEVIGSLTTNVALDADITVRGATPVVNAAFWTGF